MEPVAKRVLTAVEPETDRLEVVALEKIAFVARKMEAKREVEVEFEVVELIAVKFWRVDDPVARRLGVVRRPVESIVVVAVPPA